MIRACAEHGRADETLDPARASDVDECAMADVVDLGRTVPTSAEQAVRGDKDGRDARQRGVERRAIRKIRNSNVCTERGMRCGTLSRPRDSDDGMASCNKAARNFAA